MAFPTNPGINEVHFEGRPPHVYSPTSTAWFKYLSRGMAFLTAQNGSSVRNGNANTAIVSFDRPVKPGSNLRIFTTLDFGSNAINAGGGNIKFTIQVFDKDNNSLGTEFWNQMLQLTNGTIDLVFKGHSFTYYFNTFAGTAPIIFVRINAEYEIFPSKPVTLKHLVIAD